jgi:Ion channel
VAVVGSLGAELSNVFSFERRHRRLLKRLALVLALTAVVDALGTVAIYFLERHAQGSEVTSLGDAFFFVTVQLLTVSSQIRNPLTTGGRVVDVFLELWAVIVVAGSAGAMAAFFQDAPEP